MVLHGSSCEFMVLHVNSCDCLCVFGWPNIKKKIGFAAHSKLKSMWFNLWFSGLSSPQWSRKCYGLNILSFFWGALQPTVILKFLWVEHSFNLFFFGLSSPQWSWNPHGLNIVSICFFLWALQPTVILKLFWVEHSFNLFFFFGLSSPQRKWNSGSLKFPLFMAWFLSQKENS